MTLVTGLFLLFSFVSPVLSRSESQPGAASSSRVCRRWGHTSSLFENILHIYGGHLWREEANIGTDNSTLSRDFISLDLSIDFPLANTSFIGLQVPPKPGPPKVEHGSFWVNEAQSKLVFYGGSFEQNPTNVNDTVEAFSLWSYDLQTSQWQKETTSGDPISRASVGASAYYKGTGYYRGGQIDSTTSSGWPAGDNLILSGMLTVDLAKSSFINKTQGFSVFRFQDAQNTGFQYKDGNLVPITFNGRDYLVNLAGGGPRGHALPLDNVYIYDIEVDKWYRQPVSGPVPINTRGACTVANYAPDNSSIQITMFGGVVYNAAKDSFDATDNTWILTIPSFSWIFAGNSTAPIGPGERQDHTCHISGSQMVVIGGRNGSNACENSGMWVFDTAKLEWQTSFTTDTSYLVPKAVTNIIQGDANGGAPWDNLPFKKGPDNTSPFYNVTSSPSTGSGNQTPAGAIAGGVVGGLIFIGAIAVVLWLYRKKSLERMTDAPVPPPPDDNQEHEQREKGTKISELGNQTPSSYAAGYNAHPAQLYGDSSFPVELDTRAQGLDSSASSPMVYELPSRYTRINIGPTSNQPLIQTYQENIEVAHAVR
ncbi:hypothetical protein H072_8274 [Dactylellina haptotyla CBS 200.50]|uniref:Uncharacterized protein n=1 Tax=Dactylellina haptotyla (strain CBS 200.50) TaxID=1284197 RepID=S8A4Q8_DACHA|nr:hypothetical protein H072_8274 [Dactylellina haptotyla CBS 200.50]